MAKHLIIGKGNLGMDLALQIRAEGSEARIVARGEAMPHAHGIDYVWCAAGSGGPKPQISVDQWRDLTVLPLQMLERYPTANHVFFSSHYLNNDPQGHRSDYAAAKAALEALGHRRKNVKVVRIGSLYGLHQPERTFPFKLLKNLTSDQCPHHIEIPQNRVTPTPTDWLAKKLVGEYSKIIHGQTVGPSGATSVASWAREVMRLNNLSYMSQYVKEVTDQSYPESSGSLCYTEESWETLWDRRCFDFTDACRAILKLPDQE